MPSDFSKVFKVASKKKKRKVPKKPKKISISKLQKLLWVECKRIIRKTYAPICFTCDTPVFGSNDHTAHFIPKGACGAFLKYDLRNLRRCCYHCNVNLGGNGAEYYKRLAEKEGAGYVDQLFEDKKKIVKAYDHYTMLLEEYRKL